MTRWSIRYVPHGQVTPPRGAPLGVINATNHVTAIQDAQRKWRALVDTSRPQCGFVAYPLTTDPYK